MKYSQAFFLVFMLLIAIPALAQEEKVCADKPTYSNSQSWRFKVAEKYFVVNTTNTLGNAVYQVVLENNRRRVFEIDGDKRTEITISMADELRRLFFQPTSIFEYLKFPLCVGMSWETEYKIQNGASVFYRKATSRVVGVKDITVPAGTFRVFEISRYAIGSGGESGSSTFSFFYSPQAKAIIRYEYETKENHMTAIIRTIEMVPDD